MIKNIKLIHVNLPLKTAYNLSYSSLNYFDTYYCVVSDGKNFGIGEIIPLEGYFSSKIKDIWGYSASVIPSLIGINPTEAISITQKLSFENRFLYSAIMTAAENINYQIKNKDKARQGCKLKLIGAIMSDDIHEISDEIKRLTLEGYSVLKLKVGKNIEKDIKKTKNILNIIPDNVKIRIDANQGYSFLNAKKFINSIPPDKIKKIELFEQPLKTGEWVNMSKLNEFSEFPLMLDESIKGEEDIAKAVSLKCCSFIKLKLMKQGSFGEIKRIFNIAKDNGLNIIIGNGVQSEIGCINEAYIIDRLKANNFASENNGFLKQSKRFLEENIIRDKGDNFIFNYNIDYDSFYSRIKPFIMREFDC